MSFELYKKLLELSREERTRTWQMGELLFKIKKNKGWKGMADSWRAFINDPDFEQSSLTLERYIRIYDLYGVKLGLKQKDIAGIDVKILDNKHFKAKLTKKNAKEMIEKMRISYSDAMRIIRFGEKNVMTCKHRWKQMKTLYECQKCGERAYQPQ